MPSLRCQHFKTIASIFGISQQKLSQQNQPLDDIRLANHEPRNQTEILKQENGSRNSKSFLKNQGSNKRSSALRTQTSFRSSLLFSPVVAFLAATGNTSAFSGYNELQRWQNTVKPLKPPRATTFLIHQKCSQPNLILEPLRINIPLRSRLN